MRYNLKYFGQNFKTTCKTKIEASGIRCNYMSPFLKNIDDTTTLNLKNNFSALDKISIVIPVRNEEQNIEELCKRIVKSMDNLNWELIFVEDSSTDKTKEKIYKICEVDKRFKGVFLTRTFGTQEAFTAGIALAIGDHIVTMDGDLQHPPEVIPDLIKCYSKGYDFVYAKRTTKEPFFKDISSKFVNKAMNFLSDYTIDLNTSVFRIFSRRVADTLLSMKEINPILPGMMAWTGFNGTNIFFKEDRRKFGRTKFNFSRMFFMALKALTSFSTKP
jgi:dolichol-phosphate mannosyltransferase